MSGWFCICATQDYHPRDHVSFRSNHHDSQSDEVIVAWHGQKQTQKLWPDHCVQGTQGCELHPELAVKNIDKVFQKGYNSALDSYSGFIDSFDHEETGLDAYLKQHNVDTAYVAGVAENVRGLPRSDGVRDLS